MNVPDYSNYSDPRTLENLQSLSNRILIGPILSGHGFVNDYYRRSLWFFEVCRQRLPLVIPNQGNSETRVRGVEESSSMQRYLQRLKVIVRHCTDGGGLMRSWRWRWPTFNCEWNPVITRI